VLWSVNRGNLEMHPLLSLAGEPDTPTTLVFDLDPGAPAGILDAAELALLLGDMLRGVGLQSWPKSSGSRGVHVYVPLNTPVTFAATKAFARAVAETIAARMPARAVARNDKRLRAGRVLVDWGQNDRHKSTVAPYSLRAKLARPTVSAPLSWDDLARAVDAADESRLLPGPQEVLARVHPASDPFAPVLTCRQQLPG
jgi:bifunctional non-homologous end joining protein LigD